MRVKIRHGLTRLGVIKHPTYDGVHLSLLNQLGSVQHYYHFMMGFIIPLIKVWPDVVAKAAGRQIYVRSCAVMDPIIDELKLEGLCILAESTHKSLRDNAKTLRRVGHRLDYHSEAGFDTPAAYDPAMFFMVRAQLSDRLCAEIASERKALEPLFKASEPRVLIIDRLRADPFYRSEDSEAKSSGAQRRSVANMVELVALARSRHASVALLSLEGRSLSSQIALFSMVDIIVAQHGAALTNLLWARTGTNVIEILPDKLLESKLIPLFFSNLCTVMRLHHHVLNQPFNHGPADVGDFATILDSLLSKRP